MERRSATRQKVEAGLRRRRRKEHSFQAIGMVATTVGVVFLAVFFADLFSKGSSAFEQTFLNIDVEFSAALRDTQETLGVMTEERIVAA